MIQEINMKNILLKHKLFFLIAMGAICGIIMMVATVSTLFDTSNIAFALDEDTITPSESVKATFSFVRLNDSECSVRITNKSEATYAVIPSTTIIDNNRYAVTEISVNGFASCTKLQRVTIPRSVVKINNSAFSNCPELEKVFLTNVQTIGNYAFMRCPKLSEIVIPESVSIMGAYVFRNDNTKVRIRAEQVGENWKSTWNVNNANELFELGSQYIEPIVYEPVFSKGTRAANSIESYNVASGQAYAESFYENITITVPATYNSIPINGLGEYPYEGAVCDKIVFEYSEQPINIPSNSLNGITANELIINRDVTMIDEDTGERAMNIFASSSIGTIVLPDTLPFIATSMFDSCDGLTDIKFVSPSENYYLDDNDSIVNLDRIKNLTDIGSFAFYGVNGIKSITIPNSVVNVGGGAFSSWTNEQVIYIDYQYHQQKIVDSSDEEGWQQDWNSMCNAKIIYSEYTVVFDKQGGADGSDRVSAVYDKAMPTATAPQMDGYRFLGYFTEPNGGGVQYYDSAMNSVQNWDINAPEGDTVTLYADWIKIIRVTLATSEIIITDNKASIWFESAFSMNCTVNISSNTQLLGMDGYGKIFNLNIVAQQRTTGLVLMAKDIGIQAHSDQPAINMQSSGDLYLYTYGIVNILGTTKSDGSGSSAIVCGSLYLCSTETGLLISGGDGKDGDDGTFVGENGGNGGMGVLIDNAMYVLCDNINIYAGIPGNGGNGLKQGGYGGKGAYPIAGTNENTTVYRKEGLTNVHYYKTTDGENGTNGEGINPGNNPEIYPPGVVLPKPIEGIPIPTPIPPIIGVGF